MLKQQNYYRNRFLFDVQIVKHSKLTYLIGMGNGSNYLLIFPTYKSYFQDLFFQGEEDLKIYLEHSTATPQYLKVTFFEAEKKSIERQFLLYLNFLVHVQTMLCTSQNICKRKIYKNTKKYSLRNFEHTINKRQHSHT